jgi:hypothetical protein
LSGFVGTMQLMTAAMSSGARAMEKRRNMFRLISDSNSDSPLEHR